ncbi:uncharacterized protein LOC116615617 [Nematostella vectensis]|uniref:uncharacterized protein LOC116615617 n=1 Tax=Nematostella vectensis TaxID=45351 RepID=UPI00139003F6|nr:uncharacterized protein LOC116615617 [Nematostella vectensis]
MNQENGAQTNVDEEKGSTKIECGRHAPPSLTECDRTVKKTSILIYIYLAFIVWRYVSLVLYSVYATECFFRAKLATLRCGNFNVYPYPTQFELAWQVSSSVNATIAIAVVQLLPEFPGNTVILYKLIRIARFWSLLLQLLVVITYNVILISHEHLAVIALIEVGFILEELPIFFVVCLWNFVPAPRKHSSARGLPLCYYSTLVAFFLENFYLFILMSSQAALDITGIHEFERRPKVLQAIGIIMNATEATFYFAIMKFFWNKLFESDRDLFATF